MCGLHIIAVYSTIRYIIDLYQVSLTVLGQKETFLCRKALAAFAVCLICSFHVRCSSMCSPRYLTEEATLIFFSRIL